MGDAMTESLQDIERLVDEYADFQSEDNFDALMSAIDRVLAAKNEEIAGLRDAGFQVSKRLAERDSRIAKAIDIVIDHRLTDEQVRARLFGLLSPLAPVTEADMEWARKALATEKPHE